MSGIASRTGNTSLTNGQLAPQSLQVINCTYASQQIELEMKGLSGGPLADPLYKPSSSINDHMVAFGEVLFQLKNMVGGYGNPVVRSSLQGIVPPGTAPGPGNPIDYRIGDLMDEIVIIGLAGKTCIPNQRVLSHTENPVALVGGHVTIVNVSPDEWRTGDTLIACLPKKDRINTQAPNDGSLQVTALRRIIEPVPLRTLMAPILKGTAKAEDFHRVVSHRKLQSFIKSRAFYELIRSIAFHVMVFTTTATASADERIAMLNAFNGTMDANRKNHYTIVAPLTDNKLNSAITDSKAVADYMNKFMDRDSGQPTQAAADIMANILRVSSVTTSLLGARTLGRVTRGCRPGNEGDVTINLGMYNLNETSFM